MLRKFAPALTLAASLSLLPPHAGAQGKKKAEASPNDPLAKEGNAAPVIVKLTPDQEAAILKDVKVPEGFDVTLFANSQAANYPVFISARPSPSVSRSRTMRPRCGWRPSEPLPSLET